MDKKRGIIMENTAVFEKIYKNKRNQGNRKNNNKKRRSERSIQSYFNQSVRSVSDYKFQYAKLKERINLLVEHLKEKGVNKESKLKRGHLLDFVNSSETEFEKRLREEAIGLLQYGVKNREARFAKRKIVKNWFIQNSYTLKIENIFENKEYEEYYKLKLFAMLFIDKMKRNNIDIQYYEATSTNSLYIKLDYGMLKTIRISDHDGKAYLKYTYNVLLNNEELEQKGHFTKDKRMFLNLDNDSLNLLVDKVLNHRERRYNEYKGRFHAYNSIKETLKLEGQKSENKFWENSIVI